MSEITVGSVGVEVVPDAREFAKRIRAQILPDAARVGNDFGNSLGDAAQKRITDGIQQGVQQGARSAGADGAKAGSRGGCGTSPASPRTFRSAPTASRPSLSWSGSARTSGG
jgi:hypothetical protein